MVVAHLPGAITSNSSYISYEYNLYCSGFSRQGWLSSRGSKSSPGSGYERIESVSYANLWVDIMYHSLFICALLVSASLVAADQKFQLVWADEFENPTIDSTKWTVADNYYHCCNDELQLYTQDEVFVKNGNLILRSSQKCVLNRMNLHQNGPNFVLCLSFLFSITPRLFEPAMHARLNASSFWSKYRPSGKYNYTSGWIDTFGKFSTTYGKVEVRAKLPFGKGPLLYAMNPFIPNYSSILSVFQWFCWYFKGIWPAHWMLPATDFCWPVGGEIDIMEYLGVNPTDPPGPVYGTLHWSANKTCNRDVHSGSFYPPKDATWIDYTKSYHVFSMEWSPTNIKFFVDGHVRLFFRFFIVIEQISISQFTTKVLWSWKFVFSREKIANFPPNLVIRQIIRSSVPNSHVCSAFVFIDVSHSPQLAFYSIDALLLDSQHGRWRQLGRQSQRHDQIPSVSLHRLRSCIQACFIEKETASATTIREIKLSSNNERWSVMRFWLTNLILQSKLYYFF